MPSAPTPTASKLRNTAVVVALTLASLSGLSAAGTTPSPPEPTQAEKVAPAATPTGSGIPQVVPPADPKGTPSEPSPSVAEEKAPEKGEATLFVDARDAYERAQSFYRAREFAKAMGELDGAIGALNQVITRAGDASVRQAAGALLRRVGSLRLACARGLEEERKALLKADPPAPPAAAPDEDADSPAMDASDSPVMDASGLSGPATVLADAPEIEAVVNTRVEKWIDFYTGRGRNTFEMWLKRSGLYMEWMKGILQSEGLPTDLVHLVFVESGFNPQARSRSHAVGPWQFIRGTAKLFGLKMNSWVDERRDPERATLAAAHYLKHLYGLFDSWPLALASYNAGEGTIIRAISRQGTKDFWSLQLPAETRDYVPKFLACLSIAREPERYGFDAIEREDRMAFDTITVPGPVDLKAVAAACNTDLATLRSLNPSLLRHAAPTTGPGGMVVLRVPAGAGDGLTEGLKSGTISLPKVETPNDPIFLRHKVRKGETLARIARRYGISTSELARANGLRTGSKVRRGRMLRVPRGDEAVSSEISSPSRGAASVRGSKHSKRSSVYGGTRTVRVRRGDTLAVIAERHGTDVRTLRALNGLRVRQHIRAGARIKVPVQNEARTNEG